MESAIGGYFELELPLREEYHKDALRLNSGKNCLEYILQCRKYHKVYIPYYTCDVVLKPFLKLGISYQFYHIDLDFEIAEDIKLREDEALLYTNYYGLKQRYVAHLVSLYGKQLIIDNSQAFFSRPIKGVDTFYTCRKFFGVPDGAYLYTDAEPLEELKQATSCEKVAHLIKRIDISPEAGFGDFHKNEEKLEHENIMLMSNFTQRMMRSIDYEYVAQKRRNNFHLLHESLKSQNRLCFSLSEDAVPMVYPYMTEDEKLRDHLIKNKIFVARYWPKVQECVKKDSTEFLLTMLMQPIPVDQRCNDETIKYILLTINKK